MEIELRGSSREWHSLAVDALRRGDALATLKVTDGHADPRALALRGVAFAQLDEHKSARAALQKAERAFEESNRKRDALCAGLAAAEIALLAHDLSAAQKKLGPLAKALAAAGDTTNAAWAWLLSARAAQLEGDARAASKLLDRARLTAKTGAPPQVDAMIALAEAERSARALAIGDAHVAASRAWAAAHRAKNPTLAKEVERFEAALAAPVARTAKGEELDLAAVAEKIRARDAITLDGRRGTVFKKGKEALDLASRPALFDLLAALAETTEPVHSKDLARVVFGAKNPNASHESRLRMQVARLRRLAKNSLGDFVFEERKLRWAAAMPVVLLVPLAPRQEARIESLLADGRAWPVRALAKGIGQSARSAQRTLATLADRGAVTPIGQGRTQRWQLASSSSKIATWMLFAAPSETE